MAQTIPSGAKKTFEKVVSSMGGEDYSYYLFDVTKVEDDPKKKVQVALKVFVPINERSTAVHNVQSSLDGDNVVAVVKDDKRLDVSIEGTQQIIRLDFKPEGNRGSGGGAAATKIQEAAQCVYAAMRYYCGDVKNFTEDDFKCGMKYTDTPGVSLEDIQSLPKEWKDSSWSGANEIYNTIKGSGYTFVRGDKTIDDGAINKAFGRVKKQTNLSSEDKWNPADIWMVKTNKIGDIKKHLDGEGTIDCLNNALQQLLADGDLIGISLKKIEGSATMKLLNADSPADRKANEKARYVKYDLTFDNKRKGDKQYPMDVYFYYGSGTFEKFQARNFGGPSKGDWKLELKGKSAAQGKIQGNVLRNLLKNAGFDVTKLTEPSFNDCAPGNTNGAKKITDEICKLLDEFNAQNFKKDLNSKNIIASQPKAWRYSKLSGLRMLKWLKSLPNGDADKAIKELYLYASSQSDKSSVYYKLS
jgi:hypothetical protein|tara:strand:- start:54 stop:1466 length:1413 start_codon:yes stop_codon:yes gene_type:complete